MVFRLVGYLHVQVLTYIGVYSTGNVVLKNGKKIGKSKISQIFEFFGWIFENLSKTRVPKNKLAW